MRSTSPGEREKPICRSSVFRSVQPGVSGSAVRQRGAPQGREVVRLRGREQHQGKPGVGNTTPRPEFVATPSQPMMPLTRHRSPELLMPLAPRRHSTPQPTPCRGSSEPRHFHRSPHLCSRNVSTCPPWMGISASPTPSRTCSASIPTSWPPRSVSNHHPLQPRFLNPTPTASSDSDFASLPFTSTSLRSAA